MKNRKLLFHRNPLYSACPECKSISLRRSRSRNFTERFLKIFTMFKTYRCNKCGWRGYKATLVFTRESIKTAIFYLGLAIFTVMIVYFILPRLT